MPRLRQKTRDGLSDAFCQATMAWTPEAPEGALKAYLERHGVAHLLGRGRKDDAEARMLTIAFMAACLDTFTDWLEPARYWRVVGFDKADSGYTETIEGWSERDERADTSDPGAQRGMDTQTRERVVQTERISRFLKDAGRPVPAFIMQRWAFTLRHAHEKEAYETMRSGLAYGLELDRIALDTPEHGQALSMEGRREIGWMSWRLADEDPRWMAPAVEAYRHMAFLNRVHGNLDEASKRFRVLLELMERFHELGIDTGLVDSIRQELAQTLIAQGEAEEAVTLLKRSIKILSETTGEKSLETLSAHAWLAFGELSAGRLREAEARLQEVTQDLERSCGTAHPLTLQAKAFLARSHLRQRKESEALQGILVIQDDLHALGQLALNDEALSEEEAQTQRPPEDALDILDLRLYGLLLEDHFDPIERAFTELLERSEELGPIHSFLPHQLIADLATEGTNYSSELKAVSNTMERLPRAISLAEQIVQERQTMTELRGVEASQSEETISRLHRELITLRDETRADLEGLVHDSEAESKRSNPGEHGHMAQSGLDIVSKSLNQIEDLLNAAMSPLVTSEESSEAPMQHESALAPLLKLLAQEQEGLESLSDDARTHAEVRISTLETSISALRISKQLSRAREELSHLSGDARAEAEARISDLQRRLNPLRAEMERSLDVATQEAAERTRLREARGGAAILSGCLSLIGVILLYWLISPTAAGSYLLTMLCANGLRSMLPNPLRPKAGVPIFFAGLIVMGTVSPWAALLWASSRLMPLTIQSVADTENGAELRDSLQELYQEIMALIGEEDAQAPKGAQANKAESEESPESEAS